MAESKENPRKIKRIFEVLGYGRLALWAGAGLVAVTSTMWAGLRADLSLAASAVLAGMAFVTVFAAVVFVLWLSDRAKRKLLEQRTPEEIEQEVHAWLHKYQFYTAAPAAVPVDLDFQIAAHDAMDEKFTVSKSKREPWIFVGAGIELSPHAVGQLPRGPDTFLADVAVELLQLGVTYVFDRTSAPGIRIRVTTALMIDASLHGLAFYNAVLRVQAGIKLVHILLMRAGQASAASRQTENATANATGRASDETGARREYRNQVLENQEVQIDGNSFFGCTFRNCRMIFKATGAPVQMEDCKFEGVRWDFEGPAFQTLNFMTALHEGAGPGGRRLVEETFENIRQGRYLR